MKIKQIHLNNFKSFGSNTLHFKEGLTVITGPNGSGKSNILDAIIFVLGSNSMKSLRCKSLNNLIMNGNDSASVKIIFDNNCEIERSVAYNSSIFKLNGIRTTQESIQEYLKSNKISFDGQNIVMQEDVKRITDLNEKELKKVIEDISNISSFEDKKIKISKNLESIDRRLRDFKVLTQEKQMWLDKLKLEKEIALKFLELENNKKNLNYNLLRLEYHKLKIDTDNLKNRLDDNEIKREELENIKKTLQKNINLNENILKDINETITKSKYKLEQLELDNKNNQFKSKNLKLIINSLSNKKDSIEYNQNNIINKNNNLKNQKENLSLKLNNIHISDIKYEDVLQYRDENLEHNLNEINQKISELEIDKNSIKNNIENSLKNKTNYKNIVEELDDNKSKIEFFEKDIEKSNVLINDVSNQINTYKNLIVKILDDIDNLNVKISEHKLNIKILEQELKTLNEVILENRIPIEVDDFNNIEKEVKKLEDQNKFGTFVFVISKNKDGVLIREIMPNNKINLINNKLENLKKLLKEDEIHKIELENKHSDMSSILKNSEQNLNSLENKLQKLNDDKLKIINRNIALEDLNIKFDEKEYEDLIYKYDILEKDLNGLYYKKEHINEQLNLNKNKFNTALENYKNNELNRTNYNSIKSNINEIEIMIKNNLENLSFFDKEKNKIDDEIKINSNELLNIEKHIQDISQNLNSLKQEYNTQISSYENLISKIRNFKEELDSTSNDLYKIELFKQNNNYDYSLQKLKEKEEEFNEFKKLNSSFNFNIINNSITSLKNDFYKVLEDINIIGSVNLNSIKDFDEFSLKYEETLEKIKELDLEKQIILEELNEINLKREKIFFEYFSNIKNNFENIVQEFGFKNMHMELTNDDFDLSGIKISSIKDGIEMNLNSFSGGEKSLLTIAFVLSIVEYEPHPFYLFDEIDAALDYRNTDKVITYIKQFSTNNQVIMITHNPETVSKADYLIGITKSKSGITTVGIKQAL